MEQYQSSELDCTKVESTDGVELLSSGILTIQPIGTGTGLATLEVSSNNVDYIPFDPLTTNYDLTEPMTIEMCSWRYWRITTIGGGTGLMSFIFTTK